MLKRAPLLLRRVAVMLAFTLALPAAQAAAQVTISGKAVSGPAPLVSSLVGAYPIVNGQVSQTGVSFFVTNGVTGEFTLNVPAGLPMLIMANVVPNGSSTDPVAGQESLVGQLRAVVVTPSAASMVLTISPFSEAMTQVIMGETQGQPPALITPAVIAAAQAQANNYLMSVNPLTTTALNASSTSDMASATPSQKLFALALAGVSQARVRNTRTMASLTLQIANVMQAGGSLLDAGGGFSADPENEEPRSTLQAMQQGIASFVNSATLNKSGVTSLYNLGRTVLGVGQQGGTVGAAWTAACAASVTADLADRFKLAQTSLAPSLWGTPAAYGYLSWGPSPSIYPAVTVPTGCDPTIWQQQRILAVASQIVQQQHNYCHHYIPAWDSKGLLFGGKPSHCYAGTTTTIGTGQNARSANQATQTGVDCSNFTAFLYNFALGGIRFTGEVTSQGGSMVGAGVDADYGTAWAPGTGFERPANWTSLITQGDPNYQNYPFQPGDLLFIGPNENEPAKDKGKISHVVVWTGLKSPDGRYLTVESYGVVNNVKGTYLNAQSPIPNAFLTNSATATGYSSAYIDNSGPNVRYFEGTFRATNLVHYRRIIGS